MKDAKGEKLKHDHILLDHRLLVIL